MSPLLVSGPSQSMCWAANTLCLIKSWPLCKFPFYRRRNGGDERGRRYSWWPSKQGEVPILSVPLCYWEMQWVLETWVWGMSGFQKPPGLEIFKQCLVDPQASALCDRGAPHTNGTKGICSTNSCENYWLLPRLTLAEWENGSSERPLESFLVTRPIGCWGRFSVQRSCCHTGMVRSSLK